MVAAGSVRTWLSTSSAAESQVLPCASGTTNAPAAEKKRPTATARPAPRRRASGPAASAPSSEVTPPDAVEPHAGNEADQESRQEVRASEEGQLERRRVKSQNGREGERDAAHHRAEDRNR